MLIKPIGNALLHPIPFINSPVAGLCNPLPITFSNSWSYWPVLSCSTLVQQIVKIKIQFLESIAADSLVLAGDSMAVNKWAKTNLFDFLHRNPRYRDSSAILATFFDTTSMAPYGQLTFLFDSIGALNDSILWQQYLISLNNLNPRNNFEANLRDVEVVYDQTIAREIYEFDSLQEATVYNIASQCPGDGGPAVYAARTMYYAVTGVFDYSFEANCLYNTGYIRMEDSVSADDAFAIYPNPAAENNSINIQAPVGSEVSFYDLLGRKLLDKKIEQPFTEISTNKLEKGFLIYVVTLPSGEKKKGKLIIE